MADESVEYVQREIQAAERDHLNKVSAINKQIDGIKESGFRFVQADEDRLVAQIEYHTKTLSAYMTRLQARLEAAKSREQTQEQTAQARRDEQSASVKATALEEWIKAGGLPDEFEAAWPAIRLQMLQAEAVRSITPQKPVSNNIRL